MRILLFVLLLLALLPVNAQDETLIPNDLSQVIIIDASQGTLTQIDGDSYVLVLTAVNDSMQWFTEQPWLDAGTESVAVFARAWRDAPDTLATRTAVLHTDTFRAVVHLDSPEPAESSLVFRATVEQFIPDIKPPMEDFSNPTLFIQIDASFMRGLVLGLIAADDGARAEPDEVCIMGRCWDTVASVFAPVRKSDGPNPLNIAVLWAGKTPTIQHSREMQ
jgi:hypothetical protein